MKATSDTRPGRFTKSHGKLFFNFNIMEKQVENEEETRSAFEYEYVEVENKLRPSLIRSLIRQAYAMEDEIALINNNAEGNPTEYNNYLIYRRNVKIIVDDLLGG